MVYHEQWCAVHLMCPCDCGGIRVGEIVGQNKMMSKEKTKAACMDCGRPYQEFPLDLLLPRSQWLQIHPADGGLLCAQCIVTRAAQVPGATGVHAVIEIAPQRSTPGMKLAEETPVFSGVGLANNSSANDQSSSPVTPTLSAEELTTQVVGAMFKLVDAFTEQCEEVASLKTQLAAAQSQCASAERELNKAWKQLAQIYAYRGVTSHGNGEVVGAEVNEQGHHDGAARGGDSTPREVGGSRGTGVVGQVDDGHGAGAVESRGPGAGELQGAGSVGHVRRPVDLTDQDLFFAAVHIFAARGARGESGNGIIESVSLARRLADEVGRRGSVLK